MKVTCYSLLIEHRHGTDLDVFATQKQLDAALYDYLDQWVDEIDEEFRPDLNVALAAYKAGTQPIDEALEIYVLNHPHSETVTCDTYELDYPQDPTQ